MSRRAVMFLVLILLAAVVNVSVAWTIAWFNPEFEWARDAADRSGPTSSHEPDWYLLIQDEFGRESIERRPGERWLLTGKAPLRAPTWSDARKPPARISTQRGELRNVETAYGWPFLTLRYEYAYSHMGVGFSGNLYFFESLSGGLVLSQFTGRAHMNDWRGDLHVLPITPIWTGTLLNIIAYSLFLGALMLLPRSARRSLRRRAGRCPDCGYPAGSSPFCTECGRRLPARQASS